MWRLLGMILVLGAGVDESMAQQRSYPVKPMRWVVPFAPGGGTDVELPLSSFPVGDYLIELNAKTESGTAQELIAFKVGR